MLLLVIGLGAMAQQRIQLNSADKAECVSGDMKTMQAFFSFSTIDAEDFQSDKGTFSWLSLPNTVIGGNEGDPQIPVINELIAVPFGATPRIEIKSFTTTDYSLADYDMKTLVPRQPSLRKDQNPGDVPFIMNAVAPQVYLKLDIMYLGSGALNDFYNALDSTTHAPTSPGVATSFTRFWSHGARPWNASHNAPMTQIIASQPWDVIMLQQQSNASRDYSTYQPYLNQIIEWLDEKAPWQHQYAWLITPSYPDNLPRLAPDTTSVQMFERILQCVRNVQSDTGIELLLPCGTAIQNARTTPLDSLGDQGHLFDYLHLQDGIPCLIEAYAATAALLARYGLSDQVWTDTTWVDQQWLKAKNIQEINGAPVGMSEENRAIAKQCAIKAIDNPLSITTIE